MRLPLLRIAFTIAVVGVLIAQSSEDRPVQSQTPQIQGQIMGHVYRIDTHEPLRKALVILDPETTAFGAQQRVATTDAAGIFVFADLAPARYSLQAERTGFVTQYEAECNHLILNSVLLGPGEQISNVVFSLTQAGVVSGVIKDEDNDPVSALRVLALRPKYLAGGRLQLSAVASEITDDHGFFRFHGLTPGQFYMRVGGVLQHSFGPLPPAQTDDHGEQYRESWFPEIAAADGATTPLSVSAGSDMNVGDIRVGREATWTLRGKIDGQAMGNQMPTQVSFVKDEPFEETASWNGHSAAIQPDGTFTIAGMAAGDYTLSAISNGEGVRNSYGYANIYISDRSTAVTISLANDAGSVSGVVQRRNEPPSGLTVALIPRERDLRVIRGHTMTARTDQLGRYKIRGVIPGDYLLFAVNPDPEQPWFALNFADTHLGAAVAVTVGARQTRQLDLAAF